MSPTARRLYLLRACLTMAALLVCIASAAGQTILPSDSIGVLYGDAMPAEPPAAPGPAASGQGQSILDRFRAATAVPSISASTRSVEAGLAVDIAVTSPAGNLASATAYIVDNQSRTVLWTQYWEINGSRANLTMVWPRQEVMISNGLNSVGPVLAVNTVGVAQPDAPYLASSVPCIAEPSSGISGLTMLAYFGSDYELHELMDPQGVIYYRSIELARARQPNMTYGQYLNEGFSLLEGSARLSFLNMNIDSGLTPYQPLVLSRSPLLHYGMRMESVASSARDVAISVEATDSAGHVAKYFHEVNG